MTTEHESGEAELGRGSAEAELGHESAAAVLARAKRNRRRP